MATWKAPSTAEVKEDPDRVTNGQNGHGPANPDRALSWDPDGKKLACGLGNQVCGSNQVAQDEVLTLFVDGYRESSTVTLLSSP